VSSIGEAEHLDLDPQQLGGHFQVLGPPGSAPGIDDGEKLFGDFRDRDVGDFDFLLADQMQQQVQWPENSSSCTRMARRRSVNAVISQPRQSFERVRCDTRIAMDERRGRETTGWK